MKQLLLQLLLLAAGGAIQAAPLAAFPATEYALPCDHGLAHTPDLPDGFRRSFSVAVEAPSNAGTLPPGRRRFDAVLPDEEGHDLKTSTPARGQRQIEQDVVNEVAAGHWESTAAPTRLRRLRLEKVSDIGHPDFADHDPKSDAVVDSPERVRRFPTHLAGRDDAGAAENDDPLSSNDIPDAPTRDQLALEDVPTASTEQREDLGAAVSEADPDLPLGYRSKFLKKTFSSDAGGGGDVLRVSPRQSVHRYQATTPETLPEMGVAHTRSMGRWVRPSQASLQEFQDTEASVPSDPTGPGSQYRGTQGFRESHRVGSGEPRRPAVQSELAQRTQLDQRRPGAVAVDIQPRRRRPRPQGREPSGEEELRDRVEPLSRRRLRPRPTVPALTDEVPVARAPFLDAHLQMRIRPRPAQTAAFEMDGELDNGVHKQIAERHRGIGTVTETNTSEEVPQNIQQMSRSHNSRSTTGATIQDVPQVQVEHDGTALEKKEQRQGPSFTLIRSAVKQGAGIRGGPSPALVQKIVRNTLRRLKPQIAEHDGDVGVDILVKIIQVEE